MKLSFLLIPLAFISCKTVKDSEIANNIKKETIISLNKEEPHNVKISIKTFVPYCGGAYPRDNQLNNYTKGVDSYLLINTTTNDTNTVKTDVLGSIYLNLKKGLYEIRELYKDIPFNQFKEQNKPKEGQALLGLDENCYKKWWSQNLLKFEVKDNVNKNTFEATINKRCNTGRNPCISFTGRLPN